MSLWVGATRDYPPINHFDEVNTLMTLDNVSIP
jgi:hypothetical protein